MLGIYIVHYFFKIGTVGSQICSVKKNPDKRPRFRKQGQKEDVSDETRLMIPDSRVPYRFRYVASLFEAYSTRLLRRDSGEISPRRLVCLV